MSAASSRIWLSLIGWGLLHVAQAQVKPAPAAFAAACDLRALNRAYVASLNQLRHQLDPHAPVVVFDPALFAGAVLHTARMERTDSLIHARPPFLRSAELIGTKRSKQGLEVAELVQFIQTQLQNSEQHCVIQSDPTFVYIAVVAAKNFYTARLSRKLSVVYKDERAACLNIGVKVPEGEAEAKPAHRLIYRAF
ncbi:MAG: hypothetical protein EOO61_04385 [Hymenobacter sp.]|nr:MAG: hypothetical protein EOO61_04385 [Hymenobacter sp.]